MQIARLFHTIKYLRWEQIYYRLQYKLKRPLYREQVVSNAALAGTKDFPKIDFPCIGAQKNSYRKTSNTFKFLNIGLSFGEHIDWNYAAHGKLWAYNLNYFEWLDSDDADDSTVIDYVRQQDSLKDGIEPYPISIRGMAWIKFFSRKNIKNETANELLYKHYARLAAFPEYHLMGNHLLENGFSLLFASHYFNDKRFYKLANKILSHELKEQTLADGGHFELSPMYHSLLLQHLLDCILLVRSSGRFANTALEKLMEEKAGKMMGWLIEFAYKNGSGANVGDASAGIAPTVPALSAYAQQLELNVPAMQLKESGYRKLKGEAWEMIVDIGQAGANYQAGHAHADTLSFDMQVNGMPFIVDTSISTYNNDERRVYERSTAAHNTIAINGKNSSDVWSAFRTGERAKVTVYEDGKNEIVASHDGYAKEGLIHKRSWAWDNRKITIEDRLENNKGQDAILYLHFHPAVVLEKNGENSFRAGNIHISIAGSYGIAFENYLYCEGYNRLATAKCLQAHVKESVQVVIELR